MKLCGTAIAALFGFEITQGFATPIDRGADSAECKGIVARLLEATDESFDHYSPSGEEVFFRNRSSVLSCSGYRRAAISFTWDAGGFPPNEWFGLLAKAGKAVTGADLNELLSGSRECSRSVLKDKTEVADMKISNAKIECRVVTLGRRGMNIRISLDDTLSMSPLLNER